MNQFNHRPLEVTKLSLTREQAINKFLSSRQGLAYLSMKYPNLSVSDAVSEYKKNALWNTGSFLTPFKIISGESSSHYQP